MAHLVGEQVDAGHFGGHVDLDTVALDVDLQWIEFGAAFGARDLQDIASGHIESPAALQDQGGPVVELDQPKSRIVDIKFCPLWHHVFEFLVGIARYRYRLWRTH